MLLRLVMKFSESWSSCDTAAITRGQAPQLSHVSPDPLFLAVGNSEIRERDGRADQAAAAVGAGVTGWEWAAVCVSQDRA